MELFHLGYCTCNLQGNFEVNYTIDSLVRELLGINREYTFWTSYTKDRNDILKHYDAGNTYFWYDNAGKLVTDPKKLDTISLVINIHRKEE